MTKHYCKQMKEAEKRGDIFILDYYTNSWQLGVLSDHEDSYGYVEIEYCPFCGEKL